MNVPLINTNRHIYTFSICGFILMLFVLSFASVGCKGTPPPTEDTTKLVSEDFNVPEVVDTPQVIEEPKKHRKSRRSKTSGDNSNTNNDGGGGSRRSSGKTSERLETDKPRSGDAPIDFARAIQWRVIGMLYREPCQIVSVKVLNQQETEAGLMEITIEIQWKDKWIRTPYQLQGLLTVNKDGSQAVFKISSKNLEAEALEVGFEQYKETLELGNI
jgi:hypothetical protein